MLRDEELAARDRWARPQGRSAAEVLPLEQATRTVRHGNHEAWK
jgi:hypothetical protein